MTLVYLHPGMAPLGMAWHRSGGSTSPPPPTVVEVTPREKQVVDALMIDGADNETIARRVGCHVDTAKNHMHRVFRKVGMSSRAGLVLEIERRHVILVAVNKRHPLK